MLAHKVAACIRQRNIWDSALASLSGQTSDEWAATLQRLHTQGPPGILGYGEDFPADVAVEMRIADFVLEGPAAIGLKRTDPEGVPQRQYTCDAYESASGAEEHEEAADAAATAEELPRAPIARPQRPPPPANPLWGPRRPAATETPGAATTSASTHST